MSILTGPEIRWQLESGGITIDPAPTKIGPNSVDLTLADALLVYDAGLMVLVNGQNGSYCPALGTTTEHIVDLEAKYFSPRKSCDVEGEMARQADLIMLTPHRENPTHILKMHPEKGLVLMPGVLYIASTVERTYTPKHVPYVDGRSSVGRLGISVHETAGRGDVGFNGRWTLEITCVHAVRVFAGMRIAQITFHEIVGPMQPYEGRYQDANGPQASRMHLPDGGDTDAT